MLEVLLVLVRAQDLIEAVPFGHGGRLGLVNVLDEGIELVGSHVGADAGRNDVVCRFCCG